MTEKEKTPAEQLASAFRSHFGTMLHVRKGKKGSNEVTFTPTRAEEALFYPGSVRSNWLRKNAARFGLYASGADSFPPNAGLYTEVGAPPQVEGDDPPSE